jgi:UDP-N-acetylmuramoylalanine--D-glutamate ligase
MRIADMDGHRVCILGFGREGQSALRALQKFAPTAEITIADANSAIKEQLSQAGMPALITGTEYLATIHEQQFAWIIKSPGIPPHPVIEQWKREGILTTGTQLFLNAARAQGAIVIGVTGSKGKSTTTALLTALLQASGRNAHAVGNIGKPVLDELERIKPDTIFVQEMSSYQLLDCISSPPIAVITSFFPEHLDYHGSLEAYRQAKANIVQFQTEDDAVYYNADAHADEIAKEGPARKIAYGAADAPVSIEQTRLIGAHNLANIAGAFRVATDLGVAKDVALAAIRAFEGLPHRLQMVGNFHGINWIDDAISTTPESTIAGLRAVGENVQTVILGGQDRGNDFASLADEIVHHSRIDTVLLFPGSGPRIRAALEVAQKNGKRTITLFDVSSMDDAVRLARTHTSPGHAVLLSTASPSYGMFKNFEEKGDIFQTCISRLGTA